MILGIGKILLATIGFLIFAGAGIVGVGLEVVIAGRQVFRRTGTQAVSLSSSVLSL